MYEYKTTHPKVGWKGLAPQAGFEPATYGLTVRCATTAPLGNKCSLTRETIIHNVTHNARTFFDKVPIEVLRYWNLDAIIGHYVFEFIHPFYDGNGRTGCYLLALYLSRPLSVLTALSLSRVIAERRGAYYKSFEEVEHKLNHGELTGFVIIMLENVWQAQSELAVELETRRDELHKAESKLQDLKSHLGLSEKQGEVLHLLIQLSLFGAFPDTTLSEIAEFSKVKSQQARKYTKPLLKAELVEMTRSREAHFQLSDSGRRFLGFNG